MQSNKPSKQYLENINYYKKILDIKKNKKSVKIICICTLKENGEVKYFPLQYDDKLTNYNTK